ncbi:MFS transporter [Streptomyces sp. NPDC097619]|uniref:MFS transporter n=1 Tax=Streptomyces sp. NPDC097619 TaxID=3157228 RepID=UPI00332D2C47
MRRRYSLRSYLAGAVAARAGDEMSGPALTLAGFALAGSAAEASSMLAALTVSAAVGGPVLGALLDRAVRPGRLLAGALVLYATGLGTVLFALDRLPFALTLTLAAVTGLSGPALSGGWTAQLPRVVPEDRLPRANALDATTFNVASLIGPALAGIVAEAWGAPSAVVVSAVLIATALPAAWRLPARTGRPVPRRRSSMTGQLASGVRTIVGRPLLARATLASIVSCVAQGVFAACLPLLGERALGGAGRGTLLLTCTAVAALAADAVLARFPLAMAPDALVRVGGLVQAGGFALAATGSPALLVLAALVVGIGEGPQLAALFAVRHREAPDHLRGRIFTTGASLKITGFALGSAAAGPLLGWSLPGTLALAAGTEALAAPVALAIPTRTAPPPTDAPAAAVPPPAHGTAPPRPVPTPTSTPAATRPDSDSRP